MRGDTLMVVPSSAKGVFSLPSGHLPPATHHSPLTTHHSPVANHQAPLATAVSCQGVTKEFGANGTKTLALRGVDLDVYDGQMALLVGPSGCGKTTLISIVAGLLNPT